MDEEEQNRYVAQLKAEFDSCDSTGTGYLDKQELTALCHKLSLDAHLPLLLDTLLGPRHYARVNFEEFKEGFVAVLSRSLDFSTSEEESSYLEPAVPEEVKPKYVKGTKRYGRRSRPDKTDLELTVEDSPKFGTDKVETNGVRRAKLRRSTSLESVESLKSDEDTGSNKESTHHYFVAQGQLKLWNQDGTGSPQRSSDPQQEVTDGQVRAVWQELGVGAGGSLNREELSLVCDHIGLKDLQSEELDALFRKLDKDQDGRVSLSEFQSGLFTQHDPAAPISTSTPARPKPQRSISKALEERVVHSTSPSLLSATVGQRLLTRLDDGSGCTSPDKVITLWTEEGIHNSRDILQTLDFSLEERLCLAELTLALDNELLVSGNGIHQAALVSYKNEINYLQVVADQACQERDKAKADLELADRRNLQLVREVDDRHATMESLNESKIKGLEQEFRDKLTALRSESEYESEVLLEQEEKERKRLQEELELLRAQDVSLQEDICTAAKENSRLEEEVSVLKEKLSEAQSTISKLQKDLDHLLQDKYGGLDPNGTGLLNQEEHFSEIFKQYEQQCRELQDRNDELHSELELLKSQGSGRRARRSGSNLSGHDWSSRRSLTAESDSDDPEMKKGTSPQVRKKLQVTDKNVLGSLVSLAPPVSIETELAMEQMKEKYEREVQDLKIQLETKVNFYERSMELMRQNMEVERKDISQSFKMEISELEDLKAQAEERAEKMRQAVERLEAELRGKTSGGAWGPEQERRIQREQAELEQNYAREISNIVLRLTSEKDQLEAELKLKMDQEVLLVREKAEQQLLHMKAQHSEAQSSLLHQLHLERSRLQEQSEQHRREVGAWESRVQELEQEARRERLLSTERWSEEQAQICSRVAQERKKLEEEHQEEVRKLGEHIQFMEAQVEISSRAEEELLVIQKQLEDKLEEMCVQLEDNTVSMKAQDALIQHLTTELHAKEKEMEIRNEKEQKLCNKLSQLEHKLKAEREKKQELLKQKELLQKESDGSIQDLKEKLVKEKEREQELLDRVSELTKELENWRTKSETWQKEIKMIQGSSSHLSTAFGEQLVQLREQEKELVELQENLAKTHEALKSRDDDLTRQASELNAVEMERDRLIEELSGQCEVLKRLQTQVNSLSEDWDQMHMMEQQLQGSLCVEQGKVKELQARLNAEQEETRCLEQENSSYRQLVDQLSSQIVEMEAESTKLKENADKLALEMRNKDNQMLELNLQLEAKAEEMDLLWNEVQLKINLFKNVTHLSGQVQLLTNQLEDKEQELCSLREDADNTANQLQQSLMDSQTELQQMEEAFESEKSHMKEQLLEMEGLVMAFEQEMANPHRAQSDEVTSENSALKDRLAVLQQDVKSLEEELNKKRRKLEEMEREYMKNRDEEERLRKENSKFREEVLDFSARNLQLSNENAELSSRLSTDQRAVQTLTDRLAQVCQENDEAAAAYKQLQETLQQQKSDALKLREQWRKEKELLERELKTTKETLQHLTAVESALSSQTLKNQALEQDKERLLKETSDRDQKLMNLQESLVKSEAQIEQLNSQILTVWQEKDVHVQESATHQKMLKQSQDKVQELEESIRQLRKEKEQLYQTHRLQEETAVGVLQKECKSLRLQNEELHNKVAQLQTQELDLQRLTHECLTLRNKQAELETAKHEADKQALRADSALSLVQAQHAREVQELRDQVGSGTREHLAHLQSQLVEQQRRTQDLEDLLRSQAKEAGVQMGLQQEQYEKLMASMQERVDEVEAKLKNSRVMLQEKVNQLKEQLAKNAKSDLLLKDLYVENSQLMKALQVTEQRQKCAEKKSFLLEEKVIALNKLLRKIAPASLTA
ncbi:ninein-like protein isoform X1 [Carassius auratus]|uniref:Ninein-like protein n=1 Tax=Carassius auratus TaxID=7957 RepID=A0A6P6L9W8_CARAU|nr:ninein-like protein isoform X1 [Carassius auratus]XP_026080186.1 ninein-like protein isoform X1 [Carassius auratus]